MTSASPTAIGRSPTPYRLPGTDGLVDAVAVHQPTEGLRGEPGEHTDGLPRWCVYGFVSDAVDRVRVDVGTGQPVELEPHTTSLAFHALIYGHCQDGHPSGGTIVTVTALDARGNVIQQKDQRV